MKDKELKYYKFYKYEKNPNGSDYCFCQRPCDSNMSLDCFLENGEIKEIDMNEFMHDFVKPLIKEKHELIKYLKEEINECKTIANDEDYLKADIYQEILNKIEEIGVKND